MTAETLTQETAATPASADALLERIAQLRPLLAANAAQGEQDRRAAQESIDALAEAGAFRVSVPARWGGLGLGHRAAMDVGREVARGDGGTAWVVSLLNSGAWYAGLFPEEAQADVFGANPDARVSVVVAPTGTATPVPGGYRVSGKWSYNSGAWHATWALIAVQVLDEAGIPQREGQLLMPALDYTIEDVWYVAGMRASGSNLLVADDVFVPAHRMFPVFEQQDADAAPYRAVSVPLALLGPQLGLGRAVLEAVVEKAGSRGIAYTSFDRKSDSVAFQIDIAKAAQMLDTADLIAARAAGDMDSITSSGPLSYNARARVRADIGWAVQNVTEAISLLLTAHGSAAFAESSPIQRFWRDQAVVARHGYVSPPITYEIYGKALLGVDDTMSTIL